MDPCGSSPWQRLKKGGVTYQSAGENIAAGQTTPTKVMQSWMMSPGHRSNIMSKLNLHSSVELVRYAIRKGIVKP